MQPYRAVCFDFDYTLADATDSIVAGFQHGFTKMGWPAPDRETVRGTIGYLLEDAYTMLTGDSDPARRAQFRPLFLEVAKERQRRETVLFPGAEELLRALHGHGVKTAIVSTKRGDTIQYIMERYHLLDQLEFVIGSEDVHAPKPDPTGLLRAMETLGVTGDEVLYCGDTVLDAGTAQRAGTHFAAVTTGVTPAGDFASYPCDYVARDMVDMKAWLGL